MLTEKILTRLKKNFTIHDIKILDETRAHHNHAQAKKQGGGHFYLYIISPDFAGKDRLKRHRLIYRALGDFMKKEIHALSIDAKTAEELTQLSP